MIEPDNPDEVEEFGKNMQAVIAEMFREAARLAQYVYEECFVKGKGVDELMTDDLYHKYNLQTWKKVLFYVTGRLEAVLRVEPGKEKLCS